MGPSYLFGGAGVSRGRSGRMRARQSKGVMGVLSWYLLYCKPKQEQRVQENLLAQDITSFYPTFRQRKTASSPMQTMPLFPRYLFVQLDSQKSNFSAVQYTRSVSSFVKTGGSPQQVPNELIEELQQRPSEYEESYKPGDSVQLSTGPYRDIQAIYQQPDGALRSVLLITMLNKEITLTVDNKSIKS